jgi:GH15 family glucan-1,4-alpha-glucosidase
MRASIEDYAMIGDCETAALIDRSGRIEWLCWPDFSSPACFAALLGTPENGHWTLTPQDKRVTYTRRYLPHTLILETTMKTRSGVVAVMDFMPIRGSNSDLVRVVRCLDGKVKMTTELCPRFEYGRSIPWINSARQRGDPYTSIATVGADLTVLRSSIPLHESAPGTLSAAFTLSAGDTHTFVLTYGRSYEDVPEPINVETAVRETSQFWCDWASRSQYRGRYGDAVERSLITLKALTYRPSGGIVAAPTTSLPERVGGPLNWDYRYCWIRDASFAVSALVAAGYTEEVVAWKKWLVRAIGRDTPNVQIMYGISGKRDLGDWEVPWLPGYLGSSPVRVGNAAAEQLQQDIYGEIAQAFLHAHDAEIPCSQEELQLQHDLTEHLSGIWRLPGSGIWEERGTPKRFTYSEAMAWVALDRAIASIERHGMQGPLRKWKALRDKIHADVCKHGFDGRLNSFVEHYSTKRLDAAVLLLPVVGFLPASDPRMLGTVAAIERKLLKGGAVLRNIPKSRKGKQGAFIACGFWLVENYAMTGRIADAEVLFEHSLSFANDLGLLAEEYDLDSKRLVGNFPQALSHIALVRAAMQLAKVCR